MIVTTSLAGLDRLAARLERRAALLAAAARTARALGPGAAWRRGDLLWPLVGPLPPEG